MYYRIKNSIVLFFIVITSVVYGGCESAMSYTRVNQDEVKIGTKTCQKFIFYNGSTVTISGLEVTIDNKPIKLADVKISPESFREATDVISFLDLTQYLYCNDLIDETDPKARAQIREKRDKVIMVLSEFVGDFAKSQNAKEQKAAIVKAKEFKRSIDTQK